MKALTVALRASSPLHCSSCCSSNSFLKDNANFHYSPWERLVGPQKSLLCNSASPRRYQSLPSHDFCLRGTWEEDAAFLLHGVEALGLDKLSPHSQARQRLALQTAEHRLPGICPLSPVVHSTCPNLTLFSLKGISLVFFSSNFTAHFPLKWIALTRVSTVVQSIEPGGNKSLIFPLKQQTKVNYAFVLIHLEELSVCSKNRSTALSESKLPGAQGPQAAFAVAASKMNHSIAFSNVAALRKREKLKHQVLTSHMVLMHTP